MYNNIIEYLFHKQKRKIEKVGKCWLYVTVIFEVSPSFEVDCLVHLMYKFVEGEISFKSLGSKNSQLISKILTMNQLNKTTKFRHIFKWSHDYFLKNGPIPASFSFIFGLFKQTIQFFTTNQCEKMSCPSSIRHRDSNPRPSERESPPITTRPGLPPNSTYL